jgi:Superinfection immunity protein
MHLLFALALIPFGAFHFLPTIVAAIRNSRHLLAIFLVNLLLSWTAIGWVVALVWAFTSEQKWEYAYAQPPYRRY